MPTFKPELTMIELMRAYTRYCKEAPSGLRFGQMVCNRYLEEGKAAFDIFYEEDDKHAMNLITLAIAKD